MVRVRTSLGLLGLLGLLGCERSSRDDSPAPELASAPAGEVGVASAPVCGRVVFASTHEHELAHMQAIAAAGGPMLAVTTTPVDPGLSEYPAAISPDARTLLVLSSRTLPNGQTHDGFGLLDLAVLPSVAKPIGPQAQLRNPSWSPEGTWLVFESNAESFRDLYRLDLASGSVLRLTNDVEGNFEPAVSPEGQRIVFVSSRSGNAEIYRMSADGGDPLRLTSAPGDDSAPIWSPDGQTIAFFSARDRARGIDVFVMDSEGGGQRPLVDDPTRSQAIIARDASFSPDGQHLAFTQLVPGGKGGGIVIVALATGKVVTRTGQPTDEGLAVQTDEQATWSPDGQHLVFARNRGEHSDIVRIGVGGDNLDLEVLTDGQGVYWLPRWIADPGCPRARPAALASGRG